MIPNRRGVDTHPPADTRVRPTLIAQLHHLVLPAGQHRLATTRTDHDTGVGQYPPNLPMANAVLSPDVGDSCALRVQGNERVDLVRSELTRSRIDTSRPSMPTDRIWTDSTTIR